MPAGELARLNGNWRGTVSVKGDECRFKFDDGSVLTETDGKYLAQAANDLAGMTLEGVATIDPSCNGTIYKWRTQGHTVDPFEDTMELVPA